MTIIENTGLSALRRTVIMRAAVMLATFALLCLFAERAAAQTATAGKRDDLDVTMQIIVDPDAKLPDEVVRRIPLPARKPAESPPAATGGEQSGKPETAGAGKDQDDKNEPQTRLSEHGRETSEAAKERAREASRAARGSAPGRGRRTASRARPTRRPPQPAESSAAQLTFLCTPHSRSCCSHFWLPPSPARTAPRRCSSSRSASRHSPRRTYAAALDAFEAAAAAGMSGPAVHFNIGVCAYRLGRWSRAAAAFREVARTPQMAALAHYNLGLVALGDGKPRRSSALVRAGRARSDATSACDRWRRRSSLSCRRRPSATGWPMARSPPATTTTSRWSPAETCSASAARTTRSPSCSSRPRVRWSAPGVSMAALVLLDYQDLDSFDQLNANAGARYRLPLGDWNGEAALQLSYSTLDSEGFESRRMLLLQATRTLTEEWRLRARYRFSDIDGLDGFDGLDGHAPRARHPRRVAPRTAGMSRLEYRFDSSDYAEATLSFDRHQLAVDVQRDLDENWTMQARLVVRSQQLRCRGERQRGALRARARRQPQSRRARGAPSCVTRTRTTRRICPSSTTGATVISAGVEAAW